MSKAQELRENVARAIWNVMREYEDRCDMELEDMGKHCHAWALADAAIAASSEQQAAQQDAEWWREPVIHTGQQVDEFISGLDRSNPARASNGGKA